MSLRSLLRQTYLRIGIHTAPPGTLLFQLHRIARSVFYWGQFRYASRDAMRRSPYGGVPYYAIDAARRNRRVDGIALVFFMGLGDYLMATPMIEALHLAHPDLLIYAYVSSSSDSVNSPLVVHLLRANPVIDQVFTYRGRPGLRWFDYNFRDALRSIPENFLILPVVYEIAPAILHRETTLFETFGLPVSLPVQGPLLNLPDELTASAEAMLTEIRQRLRSSSPSRIVCVHLSARSSGYVYPELENLLRGLLAEGCLVINFAVSEFTDQNLIDIDVTKITPNDTIVLLRALKGAGMPLCCVTVNSLLWPISAGLGLKNLGLHIFHDESIHQYHFPNIFVISRYVYPRISPSRQFRAPIGSYRESMSKSGVLLTDFDPVFVLECFRRFIEMT